MRTSPAREAGKDGSQSSDSRELLWLLGEAGFGIACRNHAPGEVIGGPDGRAALHVLTSGTALLILERRAGREATIGLLKEWDVSGALWFTGDPTRRIQSRAATPCEVAALPRPMLEAAIERNPQVALKLLTLQDARLTRYEEFVARIAPRSILVRLAGLLLSLAESFPEERPAVSRPVTIGLRFTHQELAAMIVATREAVSIAMGRLRRQGALEVCNGAITLIDREKLREIAAGHAGQTSKVRAAPVG